MRDGKLKAFARKAYHKFSHQSLFVKYFSVFLVIVTICFVALGVTLGIFVTNYWSNQMSVLLKENAKSVAQSTAEVLSSWLRDEPQGSVVFICNNLTTISEAIDADVFMCDPDGKVILCKDLLSSDLVVRNDGVCTIHGSYQVPQSVLDEVAKGSYYATGTLDGLYDNTHLAAAEPVVVSGQIAGYIFAVEPMSISFQGYFFNALRMFAFASLLALCIGFAVIYPFTANLVRPLKEMSKATKAYAAGDFSPRVSVRGNDELSELMEAFNRMAASLSLQESSRRSFVANVSHELKTPMTTIGGFIDGILDGTIEPERQNHYLRIVSDETKRLSRLVTSMLNMSKIEAGELQLQPKRFDLCREIFDTMLNFEQIIDRKHIEVVGLDTLRPTYIFADRDMLHQVIYNLVDNAVKFTENGAIGVAVEQIQENTTVSIRNTGTTGISSEELSRVFERFYKVDKSRSYDTKGAGLGLYICKTIIEMHGGTISAQSDGSEYVEFSFTLPNVPPSSGETVA